MVFLFSIFALVSFILQLLPLVLPNLLPLHKMYFMTFPAVILSSITIGPFSWAAGNKGDLCEMLRNPILRGGQWLDGLSQIFCHDLGTSGNVQDITARMCSTAGLTLFPTLCHGYNYAQVGGFFLVAAVGLNMVGVVTTLFLLRNYIAGNTIKAKYRENAQIMFGTSLLVFAAGGVAYYFVTMQWLLIDCPLGGPHALSVATSWILQAQGQGNISYGAYMLSGAFLIQVIMSVFILMVHTSKEMTKDDIEDRKLQEETDAMLHSLAGAGMATYGIAASPIPIVQYAGSSMAPAGAMPPILIPHTAGSSMAPASPIPAW